jgi:hypothetical protein
VSHRGAADAKAAAEPEKQKTGLCHQDIMPRVSGTLAFRHYLNGFAPRVLRCDAPSLTFYEQQDMSNTNDAIVDVAISDGGVAFTAYFADQEPIDGRLTVVELTETSCRWPTGNPRDLKTFRYCGELARGPYCKRHARLAYLPRAA